MNELQPSLFTNAPAYKFGGKTYDPDKDAKRLTGQLHRVYEAMKGGEWFTLSKLQIIVGGSEAGISARIRDLRKPWAGGHTIERKRVKETGLWLYRMK